MSTQNMPVGSADTTIEDLQRNVSDLEKHAKELEMKLLARNQALAEHEERRGHLERLLNEREQELAQLRADADERERIAAIEKLIQPQEAEQQVQKQDQLQKQVAPTLDMFFGHGETVMDSLELGMPQREPVVEELNQPKKAYLCQPEQQDQQQLDWGMVDMDEDPWAAAAAVEQITSPQVDSLAMAALHSQIEQLEREKSELHTKTAKLMKRLKEYRSKEQQQSRGGGASNNDLDGAIIEELKHQLELQETRQVKTEELLQQHALEKEKLAKRIDVLTAGNERMAELKERQDMDVQMYQARIRELQEKLQQLESWGEERAAAGVGGAGAGAGIPAMATAPTASPETVAQIENLQAENQDLNSECQELQSQLEQEKKQAYLAQAEAKELQQELTELRAKQQELAELRVKHKELEELEKLNVEQLEQERLKAKQLEQVMEQAQQAQEEVEQLQRELEALQAKQLELKLEPPNSPSDESQAQLQEKEAEIVHLKQRIEELMREDQTEKLVLEILTKNQELQQLRKQNKQLQEEQQHQQDQQQQQQAEEKLMASEVAHPNQELQRELEQVHQHYAQLQQEKGEMEEELRVLNNHVLSSLELEDRMKQTVLELDIKNIEIIELRKSLELLQQTQEQAQATHQQQQQQQQQQQPDLSAINKQWETLVEQKCSEVASIWQSHLAQREAAYEAQINELTAKKEQEQAPPAQVATSSLDNNGNEMLLKMQTALETQEMEIVTLKEQLAIRSAEYARLASQYDPFRLQNTLGAAAATATGAGAMSTGSGANTEPLPEYVLKADLDYALMMLHQRDMRVEEMIVELVQLLEERDHLQLKLSDTLRQLEAERSRAIDEPGVVGQTANNTATGSSSSATSGSPSKFSIGSSSSDLTASTAASGSDLKQKLAELQTVKHSKDKAIVDEREQRLQQMIQLQKDMAKTAAGTTSTTTTTTAFLNTIAPDGAAFAPADSTSLPQQQQQQQLDLDPSQTSLRFPSNVLMDWILGNNNKDEDDAHQSHSQPQSYPQPHPHQPSSN